MAEDKPPFRATGQRGEILAALRLAGSGGVSNVELNKICFRFGARIWELRRAGFTIKTTNEGDGVFRSTLLSEPSNSATPTDSVAEATR